MSSQEIDPNQIDERQRLALDPGTPAEVLASLVPANLHKLQGAELALAKLLVQNPNTPKALLLNLGANDPLALITNPSFELFFLENPDSFKEMPYETQQAFIDNIEVVPDWLIERMIQGYASRIARNPKTPTWALRYIAKAKVHEIRGGMAHNPSLPEDVFWDLSRDPSSYVRRRLATNPKLPRDILENLANDSESTVREAVAYNPSIDAALCWSLAQDPHPTVRGGAARSKHTHPEVLEHLTQDLDVDVVVLVAKNPITPIALLELCATHSDSRVRAGVASNPHLKNSLLDLLALPESRIASLFSTPSIQQRSYWEAIFHSASSSGFSRAIHDPKRERLLAKSEHIIARRMVAYCSSDAPLLAWLGEDPSPEVVDEIFLNRRATLEVLARCLEGKTHEEKRGLASMARPSEQLVKLLAQDPELRSSLVKNLSVPLDVIRSLLHGIPTTRQGPPDEVEPEQEEEESFYDEDELLLSWENAKGLTPLEPDEELTEEPTESPDEDPFDLEDEDDL